MIRDLAANESNRNIGYLDSDSFRNYPNELHEALRDVVGYDGVEVTMPTGDKIYIAWFDNQMKSADPITYDDEGNIIPLSERFNANKNDIRFSREFPSNNVELTEEQSGLLGGIQESVRKTVREELDKMGKEYGWIEAGENPVREANVPKKKKKFLDKYRGICYTV